MNRKMILIMAGIAALAQAVPAQAIHNGIIIKPQISQGSSTFWDWVEYQTHRHGGHGVHG